MIIPLLSLIFLVQGTSAPTAAQVPPAPLRLKEAVQHFPQSQIEPKVSGPISIDLNQRSRADYEALAELAGLNIVFDADFTDRALAPLHVADEDIFEAFDRLSLMTGNFVEVLDSSTLLVSPNNATKRRENQIQVLKTIYPSYATSPQDLSGLVTMLRSTLQMRYLATSTDMKGIILRDSSDNVAAAEKLIGQVDTASSSQPVGFDRLGNLYTPEGKEIRKYAPARSNLQIGPTRPSSVDMNDDSRTIYEALAAMAGLNVIFDLDFRSTGPLRLKLDNVDALDGLDYFGFQTKAFWEPLDSKTILVAPDNAAKRRDYSNMQFKAIYFDNATPQLLTETITALRILLNARYLVNVPTAGVIGIMETPGQIALSDKIVADATRGKVAQVAAGRGATLNVGNETGGILRERAVRAAGLVPNQPNLKATGNISVEVNETAHDAFERLAGLAGLHVSFDDRFKDTPAQPFSFKNVSILDALDFLSIQTRTIWKVLDPSTIIVAPDSMSVRRDLEPRPAKVITFSNAPRNVRVVELVTALRTLLNTREIEGSEKGIALRDTVENVALAEKIVSDLNR
jgi:hypothetical protein